MDKFLVFHVFAGILSLLSGLLIFILKKGTGLHVRVGKLYELSMLFVFITALIVSYIKQNWFLLLIGLFSYYLVLSGVRFNQLIKNGKFAIVDVVRTLLFAFSFSTMIVWGVLVLIQGNQSLGIILFVFGGIGLLLVKNELNYFLIKKTIPSSKICMREHIGRMTGSYIAAVTAFAVNNIHFLPPLVIWLLPTGIGIFIIGFYSRPYKLT